MARAGQSWPELARVGQSWPELARVGRSWPALARVGQSWPELARVGQSLSELARVGQSWPVYLEMLGHTRKRGVLPVCFDALLITIRCTLVYPCVPLCTTRKSSKIVDNTPQSGRKHSEILGNTRKNSEILGNTRKYPEILENTWKQGVLPVCFAAPLCTPVYPCVPPGNTRK